ncbi:MAG: hypothetical protein HY308_01505 [Gammaproteobacteria bacterium]|nr:hypothetical protein [Gammaproteobacteria bacterium]
MSRVCVWALVIFNGLWALDSIALLVSDWVQPTLLGQILVIMNAIMSGLIAEVLIFGFRKSNRPVMA